MSIKLIKNFIRDNRAYTYAFFSSNFLVGFFYYMSVGKKIEIIYPLSLALFIYIVFMSIKYYEYYSFHKTLKIMIHSHDYSVQSHNELVNEVTNNIRNLHKYYLEKLGEFKKDKEKERRFLSLWIHNMKTPITVTDLLLQRLENNEISSIEGMNQIKEENKKLLVNLETVLNIIRLQDFAKDYVAEPIDLVSQLNQIINKNKGLFIHNRVFPKIVTDYKNATILSDQKWNELMLQQIISNGIKYSVKDGVSKNIFFYIEDLGNEIVLTIKDEGIGIPEHDLKKVFEPFFTGDNGRKGYYSSGIGLYFCKEISNMLGHTLSITSKESEGTSVKITYLAKL